MARRKARRRSSARGSASKIYRSVTGGGKFKPIIDGVIGGFASQVGSKFLPGYGQVLGLGGAGYFLNNPTLMTLAGVQASQMIPVVSGILGGGSNGSGSGAI